MQSLGILDLLSLRGFDLTAPCKFVRHRDDRYDLDDLQRKGWLETYQGYQDKRLFEGVVRIVAFMGLDGRRARLLGVYEVLDRKDGSEVLFRQGSRFQSLPTASTSTNCDTCKGSRVLNTESSWIGVRGRDHGYKTRPTEQKDLGGDGADTQRMDMAGTYV